MRQRWLLFWGMAIATAYSFAAPDAGAFQRPFLARIIFFHLPSAFLTSVLLLVAAWQGLLYLSKPSSVRDLRCAAATELGFIFGALTLITGILFSKAQWGAWWQNDPRQTSFLFLMLILAAGLLVRGGIADEVRRARAGAAYALASLPVSIFLIFVYPRLPQVTRQSFHPSNTLVQGGFDAWYWTGILAVFAMLGWLSLILYGLRQRAGLLEEGAMNLDRRLEAGSGRSAFTGVVRPIHVPEEPGAPDPKG